MTRTSSLMRSSRESSSISPWVTRSSTAFSFSVWIIFASTRCFTVWRARYPTYSREKIIDPIGNIAHWREQFAGSLQRARHSKDSVAAQGLSWIHFRRGHGGNQNRGQLDENQQQCHHPKSGWIVWPNTEQKTR